MVQLSPATGTVWTSGRCCGGAGGLSTCVLLSVRMPLAAAGGRWMNAPACGCVWLPWGQLPARGTLWAVQDCDTQFEHDLNTAVEVQYRGAGAPWKQLEQDTTTNSFCPLCSLLIM